MEKTTFDLKSLYYKTLTEILNIKEFELSNLNKTEIYDIFLLEYPSFFQIKKNNLLYAIQEKIFTFYSETDLFQHINYDNYQIIEAIFSESFSYFSNLLAEEKMLLILLDLFTNSNLKILFLSNQISLQLEQYYCMFSKILNISIKKIKKIIYKLVNSDLIEFIKSKDQIGTTIEFSNELIRLSRIPPLKIFKLNEFEVIKSSDTCSNMNYRIETYAGQNVASYIFSKLNHEKKRFWYIEDLSTSIDLLNIFAEDELYNEYIWINNYPLESDYQEQEKEILILSQKTYSKLIVSNEQVSMPFGKTPSRIVFNDFSFDTMFSDASIHEEKNSDFSCDIDCSKTKKDNQKITAITEEDYIKRYAISFNGFTDTSNIDPKIKEIYHKLNDSCTYLTANKKMFFELENLINQHPNIINKDVLYSFIKNAILFSKENIIKTTPLLLLGNPGCGKSLFCRQLRKIFNQDNDIFIPMGNGSGVTGLLGSTPEYKNASHGMILSSIWESMNNTNCLNPIIILDEIEKSCLSSKVSDVNQNVYPTLIQLLGSENIKHFKDNFFDVPIKHFYPNFVGTANSVESIPKPLLDRLTIIRFRDYTEEEFKTKIIPMQYESFRNKHNSLVPEKLTEQEVDIIYKLSRGETRQIQTAINRYLSVLFDIDGNKQNLTSSIIDNLLQSCEELYDDKKIGFCL